MSELTELLDADAATTRLRAAGLDIAHAEPSYVRHKPDEVTLIAYQLVLGDGNDSHCYLRWFRERDRADVLYAKSRALKPRSAPAGPGLARLGSRAVVYAFPNDARLRRLRWYTTPRKLKRTLQPLVGPGNRISGSRSSVEVLRYKPERRVVARVELATGQPSRQLLVRYTTRREARSLAETARHLLGHGVTTPAPVAQLDGDRVTIDEFVQGVQLREAVRDNQSNPAALAEAIHAFHTTPPPANTPARLAGDAARSAFHGLAALRAWHPDLDRLAQRTISLLQRHRLNQVGPVLLHGDLHAKNVLLHQGTFSFIDLERVAMGPAGVDLGYLNAHAIAQGIRQPGWSPNADRHTDSVIEHYRCIAGPLPDLAWHTALGLTEQALLVTRHLEPGWEHTAPELLVAAARQLNIGNLTGAPR